MNLPPSAYASSPTTCQVAFPSVLTCSFTSRYCTPLTVSPSHAASNAARIFSSLSSPAAFRSSVIVKPSRSMRSVYAGSVFTGVGDGVGTGVGFGVSVGFGVGVGFAVDVGVGFSVGSGSSDGSSVGFGSSEGSSVGSGLQALPGGCPASRASAPSPAAHSSSSSSTFTFRTSQSSAGTERRCCVPRQGKAAPPRVPSARHRHQLGSHGVPCANTSPHLSSRAPAPARHPWRRRHRHRPPAAPPPWAPAASLGDTR